MEENPSKTQGGRSHPGRIINERHISVGVSMHGFLMNWTQVACFQDDDFGQRWLTGILGFSRHRASFLFPLTAISFLLPSALSFSTTYTRLNLGAIDANMHLHLGFTSPSRLHIHIPYLLLSFILHLLVSLQGAHAAITTPINRNNDYVEQNAKGSFCFYPKAVDPASIDVACVGGSKGDYAQVMQTHLNLTTSINYFSGSLERLGGPEWVFQSGGRKVYLCLTGRAGDYTYQTMCTTVSKDNSLGNSTTPYCKIQAGQKRVTDGCYVPNQEPPAITIASTPRAAVVTVTRTSDGPATSTITRSANRTGTALSSGGSSSTENAGMGLSSAYHVLVLRPHADDSSFSGYMILGGVNLAIYSSILAIYWL